MTADAGATCLVLLDVDTGYMKAVPAAGKASQTTWSKVGSVSLSISFDVEFVYVVTGTPRLWLTVES